ncbi:hypothetical protein BJX64DRAFT_286084 [Aspergillus heterothallicus]
MTLELADDAKGETQGAFTLWEVQLFEKFVQELGIPECPRPYEPLVSVTPANSEGDQALMYRPVAPRGPSKSAETVVYHTTLSDIQNSTPKSTRATLHVEIDISSEPKLKYDVGDHIAVWPDSPASEVGQLRVALGLTETDMHKAITVDQIDPNSPVPWPRPVTLHALFERHLDIACLVSRSLILDLKQFASTQACQRALDELVHNYKDQCLARRMTLASVLRYCDPTPSAWAAIPQSFLLENLLPIKPRHYSIASTPAVTPRAISFTVAVKDIQLTSGEQLLGLASGSLISVHDTHSRTSQSSCGLWCTVRRSKFKPPVAPMHPMIMIANGSGIAPFLGFLRHRLRTFQLNGDIGQMVLIYGCQDQSMYLYRSEIEEIQQALGDRLRIVLAYSRQGGGYVQDQVAAQGSYLSELLCSEKAN